MKILINKISIVICLLLLSNLLFSQGLMVVPLATNPVLIHKWNDIKNNKSVRRSPSRFDTLNLNNIKFLDDFSKPGPLPDTTFWLDNTVFINRDYPIAPPTLGVATFDGVNQYGYPYHFLADPGSSGPADTLTSKPIRLDLYTGNPADSIFLSFYYQPQGRGNAPESPDSLILQFKRDSMVTDARFDTIPVLDTIWLLDPLTMLNDIPVIQRSMHIDTIRFVADSAVWQEVWGHNGYPLPTGDSTWKLVMLPITDTAFLKPGFQFRFRNYATLSGAGDQWNIDYVYLNHNRHLSDTIFEDVAFVYDAPSLITPYSAMPWRQYDTTFRDTSINTYLRNNYTTVKNVSVRYNMYDPFGNPMTTPPTYTPNVNPYDSIDLFSYYTFAAHSIPLIAGNMTASVDYKFEAILNSTPDFDRSNDTIRHTQSFGNYYAYDDGTAEEGFALNSTLIGELAVQYTLQKPDTLRFIDIYFDPLWTDESLYTFNFKVWADNAGQPGAELFSDTSMAPAYTSWYIGPDNFIRYKIPPLYMTPQTFYIGYLQNTNQGLNIGVDTKTNSQYHVFYNTTGNWYNSPYPGSVMMHPVFGTYQELSGIKDTPADNTFFSVYPNPANDKLFLKYKSSIVSDKISYSITDIYGRTISQEKLNNAESIDISMLSDGVYFIRMINGTTVSTNKFIKLK